MQKKNGLGKGMGALLSNSKKNEKIENKDKLIEEKNIVNISLIQENKNQPRKNFNKEEIENLADSIKQYGIIQPLIVKKEGEKYKLIAGERRLRAARLVGLKEVPIVIKEYDERELFEVAIVENIQRSDLNPIEEALAYKSLYEEFNLTQEEIAIKVSKNRATIANSLRLLKLDNYVQNLLIEEKISSGHARVLISIEDINLQKKVADDIIKFDLSVRETEKFIKSLNKEKINKEKSKEDKQVELFFKEYEEKIREILGTQVHINRKQKNKGIIEIEYYSDVELERILELFSKIK